MIQNRFGGRLGALMGRGVRVAFGGAALLTAASPLLLGMPANAQVLDQREAPKRQGGAKLTTEAETDITERESADDASRLHDAYQPRGVGLGSFLLMPRIEVDEKYNSNVFATENNEQHDFVTYVRPEMKLRSRFREHELNFGAVVEQQLYARFDGDNRTDADLNVQGRYDFSSRTEANAFARVYSQHEDRASPDDLAGKNPAQVYGGMMLLGGKHQAGRFTFEGDVEADRKKFGSVDLQAGPTVSNADRDRWEYTARQRVSYEVLPGYSAVVETAQNRHEFDRAVDRNGFDRDSQGYRAEAGLSVDLTNILRGDFLVGYMSQDFNDRQLKDISGLSFRSAFNWTPSKLTVVIPSLERSFQNTTNNGASALVRSELGLTVRHELRRNIIVTGIGAIAQEELAGVTNQDAMVYDAKGRIIYAFSPELYVGGEVGVRQRDSEAVNNSMTQVTTLVRLGIQY